MNETLIIEHYKNPRFYGVPSMYTKAATAANALCGDEITMYATVRDGNATDISFTGSGCSICLASASILLEGFQKDGKTLSEDVFLSLLEMTKDHKRSACALLSLSALQKLVAEA